MRRLGFDQFKDVIPDVIDMPLTYLEQNGKTIFFFFSIFTFDFNFECFFLKVHFKPKDYLEFQVFWKKWQILKQLMKKVKFIRNCFFFFFYFNYYLFHIVFFFFSNTKQKQKELVLIWMNYATKTFTRLPELWNYSLLNCRIRFFLSNYLMHLNGQ